jgi:hypothetical protein
VLSAFYLAKNRDVFCAKRKMVDDLTPTELADVLQNEEDPNWMEEAAPNIPKKVFDK